VRASRPTSRSEEGARPSDLPGRRVRHALHRGDAGPAQARAGQGRRHAAPPVPRRRHDNGKAGVERIDPDSIRREPHIPPCDRRRAPPRHQAALRRARRRGLREVDGEPQAGPAHEPTFRDAHQSAARDPAADQDMLLVAPALAREAPELFSLECGAARPSTSPCASSTRTLGSARPAPQGDPDILFQMLVRGANAVGYTTYPTTSCASSSRSRGPGHRLFRIFDSLNWPEQMQVAIARPARPAASPRSRSATPATSSSPAAALCARLLREAREGARPARRPHPLHQGHGGAAQAYAAGASSRSSSRNRRPDPSPFPRHRRRPGRAYLRRSRRGSTRSTAPSARSPDRRRSRTSRASSRCSPVGAADRARAREAPALRRLLGAVRRSTALRQGPYTQREVYEHEIPGGQYTNLRTQATRWASASAGAT